MKTTEIRLNYTSVYAHYCDNMDIYLNRKQMYTHIPNQNILGTQNVNYSTMLLIKIQYKYFF